MDNLKLREKNEKLIKGKKKNLAPNQKRENDRKLQPYFKYFLNRLGGDAREITN